MKKQIFKSLIIQLSKENSLITEFTSFVAVEKRVCIVVNLWLFSSSLHINKITLSLSLTISTSLACDEQEEEGGGSSRQGLRVRAHGDLSKWNTCYYF